MLDAWVARSTSVRWLVSVRVGRPEPLIAELILDRPEALNAISTDLARLAEARQVLEDNALSAVVLTSSVAKAFCVGADLKERAGFTDHDLRRQRRSSKTPSVRSGTFPSRRSPPWRAMRWAGVASWRSPAT